MHQSTIREIEKIQEQAIRSIGKDPFEVLKSVTANNKRCLPHTTTKHDIGTEEIKALMDKPNSTNEEWEKELLKVVPIMLPERLYGDETEFLIDLHTAHKTKYDRNSFLQKFVNIEGLCHEYFCETLSTEKIEITVSSLPFIQVNGVSYYSGTGDRVVLLNEALLYSVPSLLTSYIPISNLSDYHLQIDYYSYDAPDADKLQETIQTCSDWFNKHIHPLLNQILRMLSGEIIASDLTDKAGNQFIPRVYDKWKFEEFLSTLVRRHPKAELAGIRKREQDKLYYFAVRSFLTFVIGHEFSHFYRDHHAKRLGIKSLRSFENCKSALRNVRDYLKNPAIHLSELESSHYLVSQPTETEADSDGLRCFIKYCNDNQLDGIELEYATRGALSAFIFMEILSRIANLAEFGVSAAEEIRRMPNIVRNTLLASEHPCPLSRLENALGCATWDHETKEYMLDVWKELNHSLDWMWVSVLPIVIETIEKHSIIPRSQLNRKRLFSNFNAVGCFGDEQATEFLLHSV